MRPELFDLFELDELKKYYTGEELGGHRAEGCGSELRRATSGCGGATPRAASSSTTRWR